MKVSEIRDLVHDTDFDYLESPSNLRWKYVRYFPVSEFTERRVGRIVKKRSVEDWKKWIESEAAMENESAYILALEKAWVEDPEAVGPVVIAYVSKDHIDIGNGWHRIALAVVNGMQTIPAIVAVDDLPNER